MPSFTKAIARALAHALVCWLMFGGLALVGYWFCSHAPSLEGAARPQSIFDWIVGLAISGHLLFWLFVAIAGTARCGDLARCSPNRLDRPGTCLDSRSGFDTRPLASASRELGDVLCSTCADARKLLSRQIEHMAETIKDALLDFGPEEEIAPAAGVAVEELPPLSPDRFVDALRGKVEDALGCMADAINEARGGQVVAASEERVRNLFADLWCDALEVGLRLRIDAAQAGFSRLQRAPGAWAEKYRCMRAGGTTWPLPRGPWN
jgi:hypothetical protein